MITNPVVCVVEHASGGYAVYCKLCSIESGSFTAEGHAFNMACKHFVEVHAPTRVVHFDDDMSVLAPGR